MCGMEENTKRFGLGRILSTIGALWIALFFLTRFGLFGSNPFTTVVLGLGAFLPIAMMFVGRVITRRGKRTKPSQVEPAPEPPRRQTPSPDPVTFTDLAEAVRFDEVETSDEPSRAEAEIVVETPAAVPTEAVVEMKTSAEMVADAKKDLPAEA